MDEAEDTVKAIFLMAMIQSPEGKSPSLRYTDLKRFIDSQGREILPTMLSKALKSLCKKKELTFREEGREKWYSLVPLSPEQIIRLCSSVDITRIQSGRQLGIINDADEGWSYYSFPKELKNPYRNRLRSRLRAEAKAFRKKVANILDDEIDRLIDDIERKAKGRLDKKELQAGLEACMILLSPSKEEEKIQTGFLFSQKMIEELSPGSIPMFERMAEKVVDWRVAFLKNVEGLTDEEVEEQLKLVDEISTSLQTLFDKIAPKDREPLAQRLSLLWIMRRTLCAVVHL